MKPVLVPTRDPLGCTAPAGFTGTFWPLGVALQLETNSQAILDACRASFGPYGEWPNAHAKLPSGVLGAEAAFALFQEFNIPVAPTVLTRTADEAATAADNMGYPVVLKVESAQITHKSDVGGVALRLTNADGVRAAFSSIQSTV